MEIAAPLGFTFAAWIGRLAFRRRLKVTALAAIMLALVGLLPGAGIVFLIFAAGIANGTIAGRYHYTADVIAGAAVALAAFIANRCLW